MPYKISVDEVEVMKAIESFILYYSFDMFPSAANQPTFEVTSCYSAYLSMQNAWTDPISLCDWGQEKSEEDKKVITIAKTGDASKKVFWRLGYPMIQQQTVCSNSFTTIYVTGKSIPRGDRDLQYKVFQDFLTKERSRWIPSGTTKVSQNRPNAKQRVNNKEVDAIIYSYAGSVKKMFGYVDAFAKNSGSSSIGGFELILSSILDTAFPHFSFKDSTGVESNIDPNFAGTGCGIVAAGSFKKSLSLCSPKSLSNLVQSGGTMFQDVVLEMIAKMEFLVSAETCDSGDGSLVDTPSPDDAVELLLFKRNN